MKYDIAMNDSLGQDEFTLGIVFNGEWLYHDDIEKLFRFLNMEITYEDVAINNNAYRENDGMGSYYYWYVTKQDCMNAYNTIMSLMG